MELQYFLIILFAISAEAGLQCIKCKYSPGISGSNEGCDKEITMKNYLTDCANDSSSATPSQLPTDAKVKEGVSTPTVKEHDEGFIGQMYCFTFTSELNGLPVTERGCGSSKVNQNLHNVCETVSDKNTSTLAVKHTSVCYCNDMDGCNVKIPAKEISNSHSAISIHDDSLIADIIALSNNATFSKKRKPSNSSNSNNSSAIINPEKEENANSTTATDEIVPTGANDTSCETTTATKVEDNSSGSSASGNGQSYILLVEIIFLYETVALLMY